MSINQEVVKEEIEIPEHSEFLERTDKLSILEALIFASGEPLSLSQISLALLTREEALKPLLSDLQEVIKKREGGLELIAMSGKYQFRTVQAAAMFIQKLKEEKPKKLSTAALETLSIIAYRQPITRHDVETIRGVDPTPTLKTLIEKELITVVGTKPTVGQPSLYGTTEKFLELFSLSSLEELPALREVTALEQSSPEAAS